MLRNSSSFRRVCLVLILTLGAPGTVLAQQTGQLDPNFGSGGKAVLPWNPANPPIDEAMEVISQADGKMIIVGRTLTLSGPANGSCSVGRLLADGSVDVSFGTGGRILFDFKPTYGSTYCNAVAIQGDGKILVAGGVTGGPGNAYDLAVARLHPDGSLDTSFGSGGKVALSYLSTSNSVEWIQAVLLQPDGKILLAGTIDWPGGTDQDFLALRLLTDGSLDTSYGFSGYTPIAFDLSSSKSDALQAAALQADGKLVLAGFAETIGGRDFAVSRLTTAGTFDPSFGVGGKQTIALYPGQSTADIAHDVLIDGSQRIVLAGEATVPGTSDRLFALVRLASNGSLDTTFSTDGRQTIALPYPHDSRAYAVAEVANNKLVAVGDAGYTTTDDDFAAVRLLDDGTVDTSFGSQGGTFVAFDLGGSHSDRASDLTVQVDGGIVIMGTVATTGESGLNLEWGLAKLTGEPFFTFP